MFLDYIPRSWNAGSKGKLICNLAKYCQISFYKGYNNFVFPSALYESAYFTTTWPTEQSAQHLDCFQSDRLEMVSQRSFNLHLFL